MSLQLLELGYRLDVDGKMSNRLVFGDRRGRVLMKEVSAASFR